ncbi:MAG: host attachment protein [Pseudomonadota bacterium]
MKPKVTWVLIANARYARVVLHRGLGHGLSEMADMIWHAKPPVDYSDRAGVGHSIAGPSTSAVDQGDPKEQADLIFAKSVCEDLDIAFRRKKFDRLVICAGPYMLGLLRKSMNDQLKSQIREEVSKDFSGLNLKQLEEHLGTILII